MKVGEQRWPHTITVQVKMGQQELSGKTHWEPEPLVARIRFQHLSVNSSYFCPINVNCKHDSVRSNYL